MIIWSARPKRGPKAPIGNYQVRLKHGNYVQTYPFKIEMNPNLKGITEADLQEQFDLAMKIRDKASTANEAVIQIRKIKKQVENGDAKPTDVAYKVFEELSAELEGHL